MFDSVAFTEIERWEEKIKKLLDKIKVQVLYKQKNKVAYEMTDIQKVGYVYSVRSEARLRFQAGFYRLRVA